MNCPDCGFEIDELNESQPVCPRCGADPYDPNSSPDPLDDPIADALAGLGDMPREEAQRTVGGRPGRRTGRDRAGLQSSDASGTPLLL
jgi:hypothetical protein